MSGWLADLVVLLHVCFVLFVVLGGFLLLRWPKLLWVHAPAALWGIVVEYAGFICPLTPLEIALRNRAGQPGYRGGFIEYYVESLLYPTGLTREVQIALGTVALFANGMVYCYVLRRKTRSRHAKPQVHQSMCRGHDHENSA
jgi:hypothetical protein